MTTDATAWATEGHHHPLPPARDTERTHPGDLEDTPLAVYINGHRVGYLDSTGFTYSRVDGEWRMELPIHPDNLLHVEHRHTPPPPTTPPHHHPRLEHVEHRALILTLAAVRAYTLSKYRLQDWKERLHPKTP